MKNRVENFIRTERGHEKYKINPRKMLVELTKLFHPDNEGGGKHAEMVKVNIAYEEYKKTGDQTKISRIYYKYFNEDGARKSDSVNSQNLKKYNSQRYPEKGSNIDIYA